MHEFARHVHVCISFILYVHTSLYHSLYDCTSTWTYYVRTCVEFFSDKTKQCGHAHSGKERKELRKEEKFLQKHQTPKT